MTWHTNNSKPSTSSQEQEGESLLTFCLDTYLSELAKSKNIPAKSCLLGSETASCQASQSGTISEHSTAGPGKGKLMSSAVDSPARTLAPQGKARVLQEHEAAYGVKWHDSFAKFHPDSCSWKTPQCSLLGDWEPFSETWPRWGMMLDGVCSERVTPAHLTSGIESGFLLPTPRAQEPGRTSEGYGDCLNDVVHGRKGWAEKLNRKDGGTPTQRTYMTPQASEDAAGTPAGKMQKMLGNSEAVRGKTPEDWKNGTLNPSWVEWLMGWPLGFTDLKPLETAKFRNVQHWHGVFSAKD